MLSDNTMLSNNMILSDNILSDKLFFKSWAIMLSDNIADNNDFIW
jgi:hypothetical protein